MKGDFSYASEHMASLLYHSQEAEQKALLSQQLGLTFLNAYDVYLKAKQKPKKKPRELSIKRKASSSMMRFCVETAQELRYLEKNNVIHRDVAARNCLLNVHMAVKMAHFDLSMASKFYEKTKAETKMPIRWFAPESLGQNVFSSRTDVWSYGVLINEIYANGETPYPNLTLQVVWKLVTCNGIRIVLLPMMQPGVAALMKKCFEEDPNLSSNRRMDFDISSSRSQNTGHQWERGRKDFADLPHCFGNNFRDFVATHIFCCQNGHQWSKRAMSALRSPTCRPTSLELKLKLRKEYVALTKKTGRLISFFKRI